MGAGEAARCERRPHQGRLLPDHQGDESGRGLGSAEGQGALRPGQGTPHLPPAVKGGDGKAALRLKPIQQGSKAACLGRLWRLVSPEIARIDAVIVIDTCK